MKSPCFLIRCHEILQELSDDILERVLSLYCPSHLEYEVSF